MRDFQQQGSPEQGSVRLPELLLEAICCGLGSLQSVTLHAGLSIISRGSHVTQRCARVVRPSRRRFVSASALLATKPTLAGIDRE